MDGKGEMERLQSTTKSQRDSVAVADRGRGTLHANN